MTIRKATYDDIPRLMQIFAQARITMRESGNPDQWPDNEPYHVIHRIAASRDEGREGSIFLANGEPRTAYYKKKI